MSTGSANRSPKSRAKSQRNQARSPGEAGQHQAAGSRACGLGAHSPPFLRGLCPQEQYPGPREPCPGLGRLPVGARVGILPGRRKGGRGNEGPLAYPRGRHLGAFTPQVSEGLSGEKAPRTVKRGSAL